MAKWIKRFLIAVSTLLVSAHAFSATDEARWASRAQASTPECVEKTVWRAADGDRKGGFVKVRECKIKCSGGETSTSCRDNEVCHCECRSSGQPGCSCHPRQDASQETVAAASQAAPVAVAVAAVR